MKTIATVISAVTLAVASASVPATDASRTSWADQPGYGLSAPYYGYGYAPYGYGVPVNPAVQLTDEQRKELADQQARIIEEMQKACQQAAEFHAKQVQPLYEMQRTMFENRDANLREMYQAMQEMDAQMNRNIMQLHEQAGKDMQDSLQYRPAFDRPAFARPDFPEYSAPNFEPPEFPEFPAPDFARPEFPEFPAPDFARPEFPEFPAPDFARPEFPELPAPDFARPEFPEYARPSFTPPAYPAHSNQSAEHQARMQEIKARVEASRKSAEARRAEALQRRTAPQPEAQTGEGTENTGA
ncbi:MAG: hypothetical protein PVJ15_02370 [Gammaproteobacteria bacterium]|jgi:exonuclease VII large subunit